MMTREMNVRVTGGISARRLVSAAARHATSLAQRRGNDAQMHRMTALVLSAMEVEACLNHHGSFQFSCWRSIERKLDPKGKLELLVEALRLDIDFGVAPFQSFADLMAVRNNLVHPKSKTSRGEPTADGTAMKVTIPRAPWTDAITDEARFDTLTSAAREMVRVLDDASPHPATGFPER